jgi:hypothetical protein
LVLDVPSSVVLRDGTTAAVKSVAANLVDGRFEQVTYTIEKESGAWAEVAVEDLAVSAS